MNESIAQAIVYLFESERFYAEILSRMHRKLSKDIPMAGVCIKNHIELHINEEAFKVLPVEMRASILRHECEHILRDHIPRFKQLAPEIYNEKGDITDQIMNSMKFKTLNIAADLAINGNMAHLPNWGVFPKTFDLPVGETMEWYHQALKNNDKAKELMQFDGHELWAESEGSEEMVKEKIRKLVTDSAASARAAGRLSAEHELLVSQLNASKVDWRSQLRRFVANTIETVIDSSKKKRNRRYGIMYPGTVKTELLTLGVAMDTSGSVSDESIQQFMSEIHKIAKYAKIFVVEADSSIKNSYEYNPKKKYSVKGRGGTAYKPVFDYYNENHEIDGLIYFGDMDCFDKETIVRPKYPVLWAIVGKQLPPVNFGGKIYIEG